jgi:hypothetical protein
MKKIKKEVEVVEEPQGVQEPVAVVPKVSPITESFGSGDMNTLKNKINEIIALM